MIKPNELRIGNLMKWGTSIVAIKDMVYNQKPDRYIYHVEKKQELTGVPFNEFEPVPLTPQLLEKCGFTKSDDLKDMKGKILLGEWRHENDIDYPGMLYLPAYEVKYLHQLQNLYFALTGEELKITL